MGEKTEGYYLQERRTEAGVTSAWKTISNTSSSLEHLEGFHPAAYWTKWGTYVEERIVKITQEVVREYLKQEQAE